MLVKRGQDDKAFSTLVRTSEEGKHVLAGSWIEINSQHCVVDVDFLGHTSRCAGKEVRGEGDRALHSPAP